MHVRIGRALELLMEEVPISHSENVGRDLGLSLPCEDSLSVPQCSSRLLFSHEVGKVPDHLSWKLETFSTQFYYVTIPIYIRVYLLSLNSSDVQKH